ncbi:hypothetical protein EYF80_043280 [Liparis tanakae]|uniref:Uncharacterized protein n=1 Tax=Liparis tanakae TaxID=230148 RepID=A0A4Z2FYY2_9TELE|nr:hypothetical protein EYF80_043280 [Liparis tanakae]
MEKGAGRVKKRAENCNNWRLKRRWLRSASGAGLPLDESSRALSLITGDSLPSSPGLRPPDARRPQHRVELRQLVMSQVPRLSRSSAEADTSQPPKHPADGSLTGQHFTTTPERSQLQDAAQVLEPSGQGDEDFEAPPET